MLIVYYVEAVSIGGLLVAVKKRRPVVALSEKRLDTVGDDKAPMLYITTHPKTVDVRGSIIGRRLDTRSSTDTPRASSSLETDRCPSKGLCRTYSPRNPLLFVDVNRSPPHVTHHDPCCSHVMLVI